MDDKFDAKLAAENAEKLIQQRVVLPQANDSFGDDGAVGALAGFVAEGKKPVMHEKYDRAKPDVSPLVPKILAADAQAVIFIGSGTHVSDGTALLRKAGSRAQIVTLSNNAASGFIKAWGDNARGTIVTQVFPSERSRNSPLVKELIDMLATQQLGEATPAMVEGFAAAKALVEALRRAGKDPTPERIKIALEAFKCVDIGGLEVSYGPNDHTGLAYADMSIIGPGGKFTPQVRAAGSWAHPEIQGGAFDLCAACTLATRASGINQNSATATKNAKPPQT